MEIGSVVVTGANRGIGLEFVKQLVSLPKPPKYVFATYRNRDTIQDLKTIRDNSKECQVVLIKMDICNSEAVEAASKIVKDMVGDEGLNLLINNAGVLKIEGFSDITDENLLFHFHANTMGPLKVLKAMLPLLEKAAKNGSGGMSVSKAAVLNISSRGGSIAEINDCMLEQHKKWLKAMGYRISKAALNMAMRIVALEVKDKGILVVNMCPGWVKTDMGTEEAQLEVSDSISTMLHSLPTLNEKHNGSFLSGNGEPIEF